MARCAHSDFRKRQRVLVIFKSGKKFVDRYMETKSKYIYFEKLGLVKKSHIRQVLIYRGEK